MITVEEFTERLCRLGADRDMRPLPRKRRDRQILMKSITMRLDGSRSYTEPEIGELLQLWNSEVAPSLQTDHVTLRRMLVDNGLLERTRDGRSYRVGFPTRPVAFDLEVEDIDLPATIAAYREEQKRRRRRPKEHG